MRASLLLEDGTFVIGQAYGSRCEKISEIVFNTAMSGYEEVLTDPSYAGQIVLFTTSHIGNTGVTEWDSESLTMCADGFVCRDLFLQSDNWRSQQTLEEFLLRSGRCALTDVDTRYLTHRVREKGSMRAILSTEDLDPGSLGVKLAQAPHISQCDLVSQTRSFSFQSGRSVPKAPTRFRVAAVDCGMKRGIFDDLEALGLELVVVGPDVSISRIEAIQPDGLFFGNGPGCPKQVASSTQVLEIIRRFSPQLPTFGICLGHQLISLAFGGDTQRLEFGHHAVNHPVVSLIDLAGMPSGRVMITSQNHNFHVVENSISEQFVVTHRHMNDLTVAGLQHKAYPIFSVQFHPECNPGPHDAKDLFSVFLNMLEEHTHAYPH